MLDALPALLGLLAFGLPVPAGIWAFIVARRWRVHGAAPPWVPTALFARPLGLYGLALSVVVGVGAIVAGSSVPTTALGGTAGNTAEVVLMLLACVGATLGAASLGQRRARWAGVPAILFGLIGWCSGAAILFLSNVGMGMPGRPLRRRGLPVLPRARRRGRTDAARILARGLSEATRRALAQAWEQDALYEAASVPAFEHLARDLAVAGAPAGLIAWARRAAEEEIGHANLCFALASSYAGCTIDAAPRPFAPPWAPRAETRAQLLARLAQDSFVDGCVGEAAAAMSAALGAARATDPMVKASLERIAREEATHAELARAILAWLFSEEPRLIGEISVGLDRLTIELRRTVQRPGQDDHPCHGRVSPAEHRAHLLQASKQAKERLDFSLLGKARDVDVMGTFVARC
jgi:hypothetical protein